MVGEVRDVKDYSLDDVQREVIAQFRLDSNGVHGLPHWRRVHRNGMRIMEADPRVDPAVIAAFAILHDSQREDEYDDLMHGVRGARYAQRLRAEGKLAWLSDEQFIKLSAAIIDHPRGFVCDDPTIQACWDADRLDLGRVGIKPSLDYMGSNYVTGNPALIDSYWEEAWANEKEDSDAT